VNATDNSTACVPDGVRPTPIVTINATVPGEIITDLQRAGLIDDPLTDTNWKNTTWFNGDWAYSKTFAWSPPTPTHATVSAGEVLLVFEGIKMGAQISLNGHVLGNSTDQFLRLKFAVGDLLKPTANTLKVDFLRQIPTHGRFMACTYPDE
jgi:beta-mannosidase